MRRVIPAVAVICALALGFWSIGAGAQDKPDQKGCNADVKAKAPDTSAVAQVELAHKLAEWGRTAKNPGALSTAAKILKGVTSKAMDDPKKDKSKTEGATPAVKPADAEMTPDSLDAEAEKMCEGDAEAKSALAVMKRRGIEMRGAVGGARTDTDFLLPHQSVTYTINFKGREYAEVYIVGFPSANVFYNVYDQNDNVVPPGWGGRCGWTPLWTGAFKIVISNESNLPVKYTLYTN